MHEQVDLDVFEAELLAVADQTMEPTIVVAVAETPQQSSPASHNR
jgi:hypothetical protein